MVMNEHRHDKIARTEGIGQVPPLHTSLSTRGKASSSLVVGVLIVPQANGIQFDPAICDVDHERLRWFLVYLANWTILRVRECQ